MHKLIKNQKKPGDLKKLLGYTTLMALVFQLIIPGLFGIGAVGINTASAQEAVATTTLTVTKVVEGGDAVIADFDLFATNTVTGTTTAVTSGVETTFDVGAYTVTETNLPGYTAAFSGDCAADGTVTLVAGVDAECTITNTFDIDTEASLTVTKVVDGGDMVAGDFELFINATSVTSGVPLVFTEAPTAPLTVSETPVEGYTATFSGDCAADGTVTLEDGMDMECVITNTFTEPVATTTATTSLTVTKVVEGGDMEASEFELFVNDTAVTSGIPLMFSFVPTGPLTVSETPVEGYTATFSGDCDVDGMVSLLDGDELECVITNTFSTTTPATTTSITVTKVVEGGSMDVEDFPLFINGMEVTSGVATTTLEVGTYIISENSNANYTATFSGDCAANGTMILAEGDELECVITNTFNGSSGGNNNDNDDDDDDRDINITVSGSDSSATGGDVDIVFGNPNAPTFIPFSTFPGQVLGAQSYIPFTGQVMGAQSAIPGLPLTGGDPTAAGNNLPNVALVTLAGLLAMGGAGLILSPRSSSLTSGRNQELR